MPTPQSYKNHTRFDPAFHFFLIQILLLNFLLSIYLVYHDRPALSKLHLWNIVMAFTLVFFALLMRHYALKDQDRIIRLEERLRIAALLPSPEAASATQSLTTRQLVALRFASDAELPTLVRRTIAENLAPADIKKSITTWRPRRPPHLTSSPE